MLYLAHILQFIVHCFYYGSFAQQYLVRKLHQGVLHVVAYLCDQVYPVHEEYFTQLFGDIPLVPEKLPVKVFEKSLLLQGLTVVHVARCNGKAQNLAPVVYYKVQLEAIEIAHGRLAHLCQFPEHFVPLDALVVAYLDTGRVHERNAGTAPKAAGLKEHCQGEDAGLGKLGEPVVGYRFGKIGLHVLLDVVYIKMLEALETAQMEDDDYGNDLALRHNGRTPFFCFQWYAVQ